MRDLIVDVSRIINDDDRLRMFDAVFVDWLDGESKMLVVFSLLCGKTFTQVEEIHGVPRSTAHAWMVEAKMKLRRVGFDMAEIERKVAASKGYAERHAVATAP